MERRFLRSHLTKIQKFEIALFLIRHLVYSARISKCYQVAGYRQSIFPLPFQVLINFIILKYM